MRVLCLLASVPLAATAVILWRGTIPVLSTATYNDKVAHFLVFGALAVLCVPFVRELSLLVRTSHGARVSLCGGYATAVGGVLELWQAMLPYRSAEWLDFGADAAGAMLASEVVWRLVPSLRSIEPQTQAVCGDRG